MSISRDEVAHIARLARLALAPAEIDSLTRDLGEILAYVEKLDALGIEGTGRTEEALPGAADVTPLREDRICASLSAEAALKPSHAHDGSHFRVPPVIDRAEGA